MPYFAATSTLTVTAKGQLTLKKDVLAHLGVRPGQKGSVDLLPDGRVEVRAAEKGGRDISALFGALKRDGQPTLSIDEINDIIQRGSAGEFDSQA
jgi:acylphosphatase